MKIQCNCTCSKKIDDGMQIISIDDILGDCHNGVIPLCCPIWMVLNDGFSSPELIIELDSVDSLSKIIINSNSKVIELYTQNRKSSGDRYFYSSTFRGQLNSVNSVDTWIEEIPLTNGITAIKLKFLSLKKIDESSQKVVLLHSLQLHGELFMGRGCQTHPDIGGLSISESRQSSESIRSQDVSSSRILSSPENITALSSQVLSGLEKLLPSLLAPMNIRLEKIEGKIKDLEQRISKIEAKF